MTGGGHPEQGGRPSILANFDHTRRFILSETSYHALHGRCLRDSSWVGLGGGVWRYHSGTASSPQNAEGKRCVQGNVQRTFCISSPTPKAFLRASNRESLRGFTDIRGRSVETKSILVHDTRFMIVSVSTMEAWSVTGRGATVTVCMALLV